jgi:hypothetical protein
MKDDVLQIVKNTEDYALSLLARSVVDLTFSEMMKPYAHPTAFVLVIQSLEIFLKSRLFSNDPSLVFVPGEEIDFLSSHTISIHECLNKSRNELRLEKYLKKVKNLISTRNNFVHFGVKVYDVNTDKEIIDFIVSDYLLMLYNEYPESYKTLKKYLFDWDECVFENYFFERVNGLGITIPDYLKKDFKFHE